MALLRQAPAAHGDGASPLPASLARGESALRHTVAGLADRRRRRIKAFSILSLVPDLMPGERLSKAEVALVEKTLGEKLRRDDCYCAMDDNTFLIVLEGATDDDAMVVAHRVALEVMSKSGAIQRRNWQAGIARYPRDGKTQSSLIKLARAATNRRRLFGADPR